MPELQNITGDGRTGNESEYGVPALPAVADAEQSLKNLVAKNPLVTGDEKILVLGAGGQVAQFLVPALQKYYKPDQLILTDVKADPAKNISALDIINQNDLAKIIHKDSHVKVVINLAALLSAEAERSPKADAVNIEGPEMLLRLAKDAGVRTVFMPSSIAVLGEDARNNVNTYEGPGGIGTKIDSPVNPIGKYGTAKKQIEELFAETNTKRGDTQALSLRYGGVLTCQSQPSDGTTEEIDKMVVAAATFYNEKRKNTPRVPDSHICKIPLDSKFPMIDGRAVATETLRFLHTDREKLWEHGHHYALAEYSGTLKQVEEILQKLLAKKRAEFAKQGKDLPEFTFVYNNNLKNLAKTRFAESWPTAMDVNESVQQWDFRQHYTLEESITDDFNRLTDTARDMAFAAGLETKREVSVVDMLMAKRAISKQGSRST